MASNDQERVYDYRVGDWYQLDDERRRIHRLEMGPSGLSDRRVCYYTSRGCRYATVPRREWIEWYETPGCRLIKRTDLDPGETPPRDPDIVCRRPSAAEEASRG